MLVGLPLVLLGNYLPEVAAQTAEVAIGCIIVLLAVRLFVRWRRDVFHAHFHTHDGTERHRHVYSHANDPSHKISTPRSTARSCRPTALGSCTASAAQEG
jgi:hypothetical protein